MTTFQKVAVLAVLAAVTSAGFYEARQAANARAQLLALQQSQASLQNELERMQTENEQLTRKSAMVKEQNPMPQAEFSELLKLRGQVGQMRTALQQAEAKQAAGEQSASSFALPSDVMLRAMEGRVKSQEKTNAVKAAILKKALGLTDDQTQSLNDILNRHTQSSSQQMKDMLSGQHGREEARQAIAADNAAKENELKDLLTPEQFDAYTAYQQQEAANAAVQRAGQQVNDVLQLDGVALSQQQQDAVRQAFIELNLGQSFDSTQVMPLDGSDVLNLQQQSLDARLRVLEGVLTPDQLRTYQQDQQGRLSFVTGILKMFSP